MIVSILILYMYPFFKTQNIFQYFLKFINNCEVITIKTTLFFKVKKSAILVQMSASDSIPAKV